MNRPQPSASDRSPELLAEMRRIAQLRDIEELQHGYQHYDNQREVEE